MIYSSLFLNCICFISFSNRFGEINLLYSMYLYSSLAFIPLYKYINLSILLLTIIFLFCFEFRAITDHTFKNIFFILVYMSMNFCRLYTQKQISWIIGYTYLQFYQIVQNHFQSNDVTNLYSHPQSIGVSVVSHTYYYFVLIHS